MTFVQAGTQNHIPIWLQEASRFQKLLDLGMASRFKPVFYRRGEHPEVSTRDSVRSKFQLQLQYPSNAWYHVFTVELYYAVCSARPDEFTFERFETAYFRLLELWIKNDPAFEEELGGMELARD